MVKDLSLTKNDREWTTFQMVLSDPSTRPNSPTLTMMNPNMPMPLSFFAFEKKELIYSSTVLGAKGRKCDSNASTCFGWMSMMLAAMKATTARSGIRVSSRAYARAEARVMHALRKYSEKTIRQKNKEFYTRINKPALPLLERFQRLLWAEAEVMEKIPGENKHAHYS